MVRDAARKGAKTQRKTQIGSFFFAALRVCGKGSYLRFEQRADFGCGEVLQLLDQGVVSLRRQTRLPHSAWYKKCDAHQKTRPTRPRH